MNDLKKAIYDKINTKFIKNAVFYFEKKESIA